MDQVNLYDISKAFYQRSYRDPICPLKAKAYSTSRQLWHEPRPKKELLGIIAELQKMERAMPRISVFYADRAEKAVRTGNYFVSVPHEIAHRYNDRPGTVYILTSRSRPGECKLGATTMSMYERCAAYESKYGYGVATFFSIDCGEPFALEKRVADKISGLRTVRNAAGDSIEWYHIKPEELKRIIISTNRENPFQ